MIFTRAKLIDAQISLQIWFEVIDASTRSNNSGKLNSLRKLFDPVNRALGKCCVNLWPDGLVFFFFFNTLITFSEVLKNPEKWSFFFSPCYYFYSFFLWPCSENYWGVGAWTCWIFCVLVGKYVGLLFRCLGFMVSKKPEILVRSWIFVNGNCVTF